MLYPVPKVFVTVDEATVVALAVRAFADVAVLSVFVALRTIVLLFVAFRGELEVTVVLAVRAVVVPLRAVAT